MSRLIECLGLHSRLGLRVLGVISNDGHFIKSIGLVCRNDKAAIEYAKQFIHAYNLELWQGDRRVTTFKFDKQSKVK